MKAEKSVSTAGDQKPTEPAASGEPTRLAEPRRRRRRLDSNKLDFWAARIGNGLLCASVIFAAFIVYAFTAKATYRSSALVWLEMPKDKSPLLDTEPLSSSQKLRMALLDAELSRRLSREFGPPSAAAQAEAVRHVGAGIDVSSPDGRAYSIAFQDSDRFRAQRIASALARRAAEVLPEVIAKAPAPAQAAPDDDQKKRVDELRKFIAAHPEVADGSQAPAHDEQAEKAKIKQAIANDATMAGLYRERARVTARLAELEGPKSMAWTDNPYDDSEIWTSATKLRKRMSEIDRSLEARRRVIASAEKPSAAAVAPELRAEWKRLLELVGKPEEKAPPAQPVSVNPLRAKVVKSADLPHWPTQPNRLLLIWLGGLLGLGAGAMITFRSRPKPVRAAGNRGLTPWPSFPTPIVRPNAPAIARSLPVPRARQRSLSPPALALVRPLRREIGPGPLSFDRPASAPRRNWTPALVGDGGGGQMIPITRSRPESRPSLPGRNEERAARRAARSPTGESPTGDTRRQSRPRQTLMFGSVEGPIEAPADDERAVAIQLRFSDARSNAATPRERAPAGVVPHALDHEFRPDRSLAPETRAELAKEIYPLAAEGCVVLAVAGAPTELKSRVAAELALALAALDSGRVLLVEGDFERPAVDRLLGLRMPRAFGFSRQLRARSQGQLDGWSVVRCQDSLDVLAEGAMRSPGAVANTELGSGLRDLCAHYAYIVIDAPALSSARDCRAVDAVCDALVVVHSPEAASELSRAATLFGKKRFSRTLEVR